MAYIETPDNVSGNAIVSGNAMVCGNADIDRMMIGLVSFIKARL